MKLELLPDEADFLVSQLRRHLEEVEAELVRTDKHQLQHALARDLERLRTIFDRLVTAARTDASPSAANGRHGPDST